MLTVDNYLLEWISGDDSSIAEWSYGNASDGVVYHQIYRQTQEAWSEISDQTEFGYWYWATTTDDGYSYQNGEDVVVRGQFIDNGTLANTQDTNYRAIDDDWPVFAHAFDLGTVDTTPVSRLWSIGLCQDEPIQYAETSGLIAQSSYYLNYFDTHLDAVCQMNLSPDRGYENYRTDIVSSLPSFKTITRQL